MSSASMMLGYVYTCFDPEIRLALLRIFDSRFGSKGYFYDSDPGAEQNLVSPEKPTDPDYILRKIRRAYNLHQFGLVVLVGHSNCGSYKLAGKEFVDLIEEEEFHKKELEGAARIILKEFPGMMVEIQYFDKAGQQMKWNKIVK